MLRSIVCETPNQFIMKNDLSKPEVPHGHALVRIRYVGICGTDIHAYKGNQPFFTYPRVLGHELSGTVEEINDATCSLAPGTPVAIIPYMHCGQCLACKRGRTNCCTHMRVLGVHMDGGMQDLLAVPIRHLIPVSIDSSLSLEHAALLEPLAIGAHAVARAALEPGDTVLVIGAGPIGLGVMAFARAAGATVIAMDMDEQRLTFSQSWAGVATTVVAGDTAEDEIAEWTNGDMATTVFDATGNVHSMNAAHRYAAHSGQVVFVGLVKNDIQFYHPDVHKKELSIHMSRNATYTDFETVLALLNTGELQMEDYITHRCTLTELPDTFESWLSPQARVIKAIVEL
ncbi:zinc-binding alcohol dehydrogenase family protein [Aureibacillus halotolerans]|uniref:2-desacetyl-2-hydroxyethyl bacteriochlorophyllide A dehydrogenase n=1 Tax=Aureibacillus halotolerans TaxID=1508390 RepID=A0A4V3D4K3_9BACI|nr:zinc-binding alcohol dehydrogenase family protein [Aureibacillus halotolerans]TDQ36557.1 hypothetical protein EV213_11721 [Aureibacillus halotolerans]